MSRPRDLPDARSWNELWERADAARKHLLLLDFDGTLAPLEVDREKVRPSERVRHALAGLDEGDVALAVVSGRPLDEVEARFHDLSAHLVGEHGWEEKPRGEARSPFALPEATAALLLSGFESMRERVPASRLERKRTSVVLHVRGLPPEETGEHATAVARLWGPLKRHAAVEVRATDGGWELRARGRDKGTAVASLLGRHGLGTFALYLGDDLTDEDAFAAVARSGFGILVGDPDRSTRAHARLPDPEAVVEFLELYRERVALPSSPRLG